MYVYLDIETIPSQRNEAREIAAARVHHPAQMKKAETIAAWERDQRPAAEETEWAKSALNGAWGEIACICWAIGDGPVCEAVRPAASDSEADCLAVFFAAMAEAQESERGRPIHWIGFNLAQFDLRVLWQRAVVLGLEPPIPLRQEAKPWGDDVIDLMVRWAGPRGSIKLTELCAALRVDVGHEDTITGADVWREYKAGRFDTILAHCRADVERTRAVHRRISFAG